MDLDKKEKLQKDLTRKYLLVEKKLTYIPACTNLRQFGLEPVTTYNRVFGSWNKFLAGLGRQVESKAYTRKSNPKRFFYPQEWLRFINTIANQDHKFWFEFYLHTGVRYKELKAVQVRDINTERETLLIRDPKASLGRTGKQREIEISTYLRNRIAAQVKAKGLGRMDTFGIPRVQYLDKRIKTYARKAQVEDWQNFSMHNLRKTFETWCCASLNINPIILSHHMGHTIDVASMYYVGLSLLKSDDKVLIRTILDNLFIKQGQTQTQGNFGQVGMPQLPPTHLPDLPPVNGVRR